MFFSTKILRFCIFFSVLSLLSVSLQSQVTKRIYFIGNSVTDAIDYAGFEAIALNRGNTHIWGRSMTPGAPLEYLWNNEPSFSQSPYGSHTNALVNYTWDVLTLQPFDRAIYGTGGDLSMVLNFMNEARDKSPDLQCYVYSRWPRTPNSKDPSDPSLTAEVWEKCWLGTYSSFQSTETRLFFEQLTDTLRHINTGLKPVCMIPVGDVFYELNKKMKNGQLPGFSKIWEVYSDGIHMQGMGSFIAAVTFYATIYKQDPRGLTVPPQFGSIAPELAEQICQTVYEVVFSHPLSGTSLDDLVPVSAVSISDVEMDIPVLNSVDLSCTILPENAANKNVSWSSENTSIAVVSTKGRVTGLSAGTTQVIVRTSDGSFRDTCTIHVTGSLPGTTQSGILAAWDFTGMASVDSVPAVVLMEGIGSGSNSGIAALGAGLTKADYVGNGLYGVNQTTLNLTSALAGKEYFSFVIEPENGRLISVDTIELAIVNQNNPRYFTLMSSLNGFNENGIIDSVHAPDWLSRHTVLLSGHTTIPGQIEFRCYVYGYNNSYESVGFGAQSGYDVIIKGSVFTPSDTIKPTTPEQFEARLVRAESLSLSWDESTDNLVVWGYNLYRDGKRINSELLKENVFTVTGLSAGTSYAFSVTAVDFLGNESEPAVLNVMTNRRPEALITADVLSGNAPLPVHFSAAESSDPDEGDFILGFNWDFGDQSAMDLSGNPVHLFENPGSYTVKLRVVDNRELYSLYDTCTIEVYDPSSNILRLKANEFSIFPNPVRESVTIRYSLLGDRNISDIVLTDNQGRTLKTLQVIGRQTAITLNVSDLEMGIYYLHFISSDGLPQTAKMMIVR
jgi:hypothetical protein